MKKRKLLNSEPSYLNEGIQDVYTVREFTQETTVTSFEIPNKYQVSGAPFLEESRPNRNSLNHCLALNPVVLCNVFEANGDYSSC